MQISEEDCKKWITDKRINPLTGRAIKPTGVIYKTLQTTCDELNIFSRKPSIRKITSGKPSSNRKVTNRKPSSTRKITSGKPSTSIHKESIKTPNSSKKSRKSSRKRSTPKFVDFINVSTPRIKSPVYEQLDNFKVPHMSMSSYSRSSSPYSSSSSYSEDSSISSPESYGRSSSYGYSSDMIDERYMPKRMLPDSLSLLRAKKKFEDMGIWDQEDVMDDVKRYM